jgi:hypothetical protein
MRIAGKQEFKKMDFLMHSETYSLLKKKYGSNEPS